MAAISASTISCRKQLTIVSTPMRTWTVDRRYNDFVALNTELISSTNKQPPASLPPKHPWSLTRSAYDEKVCVCSGLLPDPVSNPPGLASYSLTFAPHVAPNTSVCCWPALLSTILASTMAGLTSDRARTSSLARNIPPLHPHAQAPPLARFLHFSRLSLRSATHYPTPGIYGSRRYTLDTCELVNRTGEGRGVSPEHPVGVVEARCIGGDGRRSREQECECHC